MNATELEAEYIDQIQRVSCLLLLPADDAIQLVRSCGSSHAVRFLGVEAYRRLEDGRVQPGSEFSNISFGQIENDRGTLKLKTFERRPRTASDNLSTLHDDTVQLINEGKGNGFDWYEVSIEDLDTQELLFFRKFPQDNKG